MDGILDDSSHSRQRLFIHVLPGCANIEAIRGSCPGPSIALQFPSAMANPEHVAILKQGVKVWNGWREDHQHEIPNFDAEMLSGMELRAANLSGARFGPKLLAVENGTPRLKSNNLTDVDLTGANLTGAIFRGSLLFRANLTDADCQNAVFQDCIMQSAKMASCNLTEAQFSACILDLANLENAILGNTLFCRVDCKGLQGLDKVRHKGESFFDLDMLSTGLEEGYYNFFHAAGVSDSLLNYVRSLTVPAVNFHSVFISYSSLDQELASQVYRDLKGNGVRCFFAPEDLRIGDQFRQRIEEAIHLRDKLLLILSQSSVQSTWVQDEVETALERERRENRLVLFPIRIDEAVMKTQQAWAASIRRTRHIGDFTKWSQPTAYQQAFQKLLRDLKAEEKRATQA